jgi:hypothetical protein
MYDRQAVFEAKFKSAALELSTKPTELISIKVRENVPSYEKYKELIQHLNNVPGTHSKSIEGEFSGSAYLVENSKTRIIVVEHETGLEIISVIGSVASLVGLVPLALRCWNFLRDRDGRGHRRAELQEIEIRRLDSAGVLIEEDSGALSVPWSDPLISLNTVMLSAAELMDGEIVQLKARVERVELRLQNIEECSTNRGDGREEKKKGKKKEKEKKKRK